MAFVLGFGCRLPGANCVSEALHVFRNGLTTTCSTREGKPVDIRTWKQKLQNPLINKMLPPLAGLIDSLDQFDPGHFGISNKQAKEMDPQHRMALETSYECIQDSGIPLEFLQSIKTGVFVGAGSCDNMMCSMANENHISEYSMQGSTTGNIANIVSFCLNLKGFSFSADSACSSSLSALHCAKNDLQNENIDAALVIGTNILLNDNAFIGFSAAKMLSPTGQSRPFHKDANGFVRTDGCVVTLLLSSKACSKLQNEYSNIAHDMLFYAELLQTGNSENGRNDNFISPQIRSQQDLFQTMVNKATENKRNNNRVVIVEAHGTGTQKGDPIETASISNALYSMGYGTEFISPFISSSKANFGHSETASGMVGLMRACLSLCVGEAFPVASVQNESEINPEVESAITNKSTRNAPVVFPYKLTRLDDAFPQISPVNQLAVVNSFGYGGANSCAVLKCVNRLVQPLVEPIANQWQIVDISCPNEEKLNMWKTQIADSVAISPLLNQSTHIKPVSWPSSKVNSIGLINKNKIKWINSRNKGDKPIKIAFIYSGQGSQHARMGVDLYKSSTIFRDYLEMCDSSFCKASSYSLLDSCGFRTGILDEAQLSVVTISMPMIIFIQTALTLTLLKIGIKPHMVMGHSTGELSAQFAQGLIPLDTLMKVVFERSRGQKSMKEGRMMALFHSIQEFESLICHGDFVEYKDDVFVAAINTTKSITISGSIKSINELSVLCLKLKLKSMILPNVEKAYHSPYTHVMHDDFKLSLIDVMSEQSKNVAEIPDTNIPVFVSTVYGKPMKHTELDLEYWWSNVKESVNFVGGCQYIQESNCTHIIEIGPRSILKRYIQDNISNSIILCTQNSQTNNMFEDLLSLVCELGASGVEGIKLDLLIPIREMNKEIYDKCLLMPWQHQTLRSKGWESAISNIQSDNSQLNFDFIKDHVIQNGVIAPGALFVSEALRTSKGNIVTNFVFDSPCNLSKDFKSIDNILTPNIEQANDFTKRISYSNGANHFDLCHPLSLNNNLKEEELIDFDIKTSSVTTNLIYQSWRKFSGIDYGKRFQLLKSVLVSRDMSKIVATGEYKIPEDINDAELRFTPYLPTIIDNAFQACGVLIPLSKYSYVPRFIQKVILHETKSKDMSQFTVKAIIKSINSKNNLELRSRSYVFDATIYNCMEEPIISIFGLDMQPISNYQNDNELPSTFELILSESKRKEPGNNYQSIIVPSDTKTLMDAITFISTSINLQNVIVCVDKSFTFFGGILGYLRSLSTELLNDICKPTIIQTAISDMSKTSNSWKIIIEQMKSIEDKEVYFENGQNPLSRRMKKYNYVMNNIEKNNVETNIQLKITRPGTLSSIFWANTLNVKSPPPSTQVTIKPVYVSLHFKDVMLALGKLIGFIPRLGMEAVAQIVDPGLTSYKAGEYVLCLDFGTSDVYADGITKETLFTTKMNYPANLLIKLQDYELSKYSLADLSGYLGVTATALYALKYSANLGRGQTVLIHSGMGGVGQAAIQIAKYLGAVVFTSAGSLERRRQLRAITGLPLSHILDSRKPLTWKSEINKQGYLHGVDVVLNSIAGLGMIESMKCLAPLGKFLEIGKKDILEGKMVSLQLLKNNISFHSIHLDLLSDTHLEVVMNICNECMRLLRTNVLEPVHSTTYYTSEIADVIRKMSKGVHAGKIIIDMMHNDSQIVKSDVTTPLNWIQENSNFLITGVSGLGVEMMLELITRGAYHFTIANNRSANLSEFQSDYPKVWKQISKLVISKQLHIDFVKINNWNSEEEWEMLLSQTLLPITGIFHLATGYTSGKALEVNQLQIDTGYYMKAGTMTCLVNIFTRWSQDSFMKRIVPKFLFVSTSMVGTYGNDLQSVYSAANTQCVELTRNSSVENCAIIAVDLPIIFGAGRLSELWNSNELWYNIQKGFEPVSVDKLLKSIFSFITSNKSIHVVIDQTPLKDVHKYITDKNLLCNLLVRENDVSTEIVSINKKEIQKISKSIEERLADILECDIGLLLKEQDKPLMDLGLDSFGRTLLKDWCLSTCDDVNKRSQLQNFNYLDETATICKIKSIMKD